MLKLLIVTATICRMVTINYGPGIPLEQVLVCDYPSSNNEEEENVWNLQKLQLHRQRPYN
jgi:hypothetical protein